MAIWAAAVHAETQNTSLDRFLTPEEQAKILQHIQLQINEQRWTFIQAGRRAVTDVKREQLSAFAEVMRLDPNFPDGTRVRELEKKIAAEIMRLPELVPYRTFAQVNETAEEHAETLIKDGLDMAHRQWLDRVRAVKPEKATTFTLVDLANRRQLKRNIVYAMMGSDTATTAERFQRLAQDTRSQLLDRADDLLEPRARQLTEAAIQALHEQSQRADFPWPPLAVDSDEPRVKRKRVAEAMDRLLQEAGVAPEATLEELRDEANALAMAWFTREHLKVLLADQRQRLKLLKEQYARYRHEGGNDPLPAVPRLAPNASAASRGKHLEDYVDQVLAAMPIDRHRVRPKIRKQVQKFVKPIVDKRLEARIKFAAEMDKYKTLTLNSSIKPTRVVSDLEIRPSTPTVSGTSSNQPKLTAPEGIDPKQWQELKYWRAFAKRAIAAEAVEKAKKSYIADPRTLTRDSLARLDLPRDVREALEPLVGRVYESEVALDRAIRDILPREQFARYIGSIVRHAEHRGLPNLELSFNRTQAIALHRRQLLEKAGFGGSTAFSRAELETAQETAEKLAKGIVKEQIDQRKTWKARATMLGKRLQHGGRNKLKSVIGFRSLKADNTPYLFAGSTERNAYAKRVSHQLFHNEPWPVRASSSLVREVEKAIKKESEVAQKEFKTLIRPIMWADATQRHQGVVRAEVIQHEYDPDRKKAIVDHIVRVIEHQYPDIATLANTPEGKFALRQHAEALAQHIKQVPSPRYLKRLNNRLDTLRLGNDGLPTDADLGMIPSHEERVKTLQEHIQQLLKKTPALAAFRSSPVVEKQLTGKAHELANLAVQVAAAPPQASAQDSSKRQEASQTPIPNSSQHPTLPGATPQNPGANSPAPSTATLAQGASKSPHTSSSPPVSPTQPHGTELPPSPPAAVVAPPDEPPMAQSNPTPEPLEIDLRFIFEASDNSPRCIVTIQAGQEELRRIITRATKQKMFRQIAEVHEELKDELLYKVILAAFAESEGQEAQFNVVIKTKGPMVPMAAVSRLAKLADSAFKDLNRQNKLIKPHFTTWSSDQGGVGGKISELLARSQ